MTADMPIHDQVVNLSIGGMTCASCAARVEKKLNRMPGVTAEVNYALETARVHVNPDVSGAPTTAEDLIATVEATGYTAALPSSTHPSSVQLVPASCGPRGSSFKRSR